MTAEDNLIKGIGTKIENHKVKIGRFVVNYIKCGKGEPILLIHGINLGWGQWYKNVGSLSSKHTVYAIDLPGAGKSSKINYSTMDFESDYVQVVRSFIKLLRLNNLTIIGHSIGGWVALKLAFENNLNIKTLVLVNPVGLTTSVPVKYFLLGIGQIAKFLSSTVMKPNKKNMEKFLGDAFFDKQKLDKTLINYYYEGIEGKIKNHPFMLINRISSSTRVRPQFVLSKKLNKLNTRTLVVSGAKDYLITPGELRRSSKLLKNSRIEIIKNAAHVPFIEKSDEFNKIVLNFID